MRTIGINASRKYDVYINRGLLACAGEIIKETSGGYKAFVITDTNVGPVYLNTVGKSLADAGYDVSSYIMPAGEEHKTLAVFGDILEHMAAAGLSRKDVAVALGGGVVGDMSGFSASAYMRGISYVQIPTTLLAAVDSSVGGKTGVDLSAGKNLAGAFYQPAAVICDPATFDTLPEREWKGGRAEILKYGMIADPALLEGEEDIEETVEKCVRIKADIVGEDEFESGSRKLLNFGHTIGHAVEKASGYTLHHGEAVAIGMAAVCDIAEALGICGAECKEALTKALKRYGISYGYGYDNRIIAENISRDKKASAKGIDMIFPERPGRCIIKNVKMEEITGLLENIRIGD